MPKNAIIPDGIISTGEAVPESAKEKFERERLTRRQALKKFGMTSAMAAFALFSVDDLAHIVGRAMQQRAGDNKVAEQVAREFQQAGIAFAGGLSNPSGTLCQSDYDCSGCNSNQIANCCLGGTSPARQLDCCAKSSNKWTCCTGITYGLGGPDMGGAFLLCMAHPAP